jgi:hypothetical protein
MLNGIDRFAGAGILMGASFFVATLATSLAQSPISQNVDRAQLLRNQQPGLREGSPSSGEGADGEAVASPNDPDLGEQAILKRADEYQPWTLLIAAPISYTSNVALVSTGEKGDALFTPSFGLSYAPRITKTLFANFSIGQQYFYYDRFSELNFGSFDARAGLFYTLPQFHNLSLRADYAYNRLTSDDSFNEFYSSHSLNFGAEIPFRFGRAQQISVGVDLSFNIASDPDEPGRHDFSSFVAYSVNLTRALNLNAIARLAVRDYTESDRTDVSGIFALSANYRLTRWLSLSASGSYAVNDSNRDVFDYEVANIGGAVSVTFKF